MASAKKYQRKIERMLERHSDNWSLAILKSGHFKVTLRRGDRKRFAFTGTTPSCSHAINQFERDVKREIAILKQEGTT